MKRIVILAAVLVLVGCESNFDKCINAETAKLEAVGGQKALLDAFAKLDAFGGKVVDAMRVMREARAQVTVPDRCKDLKIWDKKCGMVDDQRYKAEKDALEAAGLSEVDDALMEVAVQERKFAESSGIDFAKSDEQEALNKKYVKAENIYEAIAVDVEMYPAMREFYITEIRNSLKQLATEICNQRGLY